MAIGRGRLGAASRTRGGWCAWLAAMVLWAPLAPVPAGAQDGGWQHPDAVICSADCNAYLTGGGPAPVAGCRWCYVDTLSLPPGSPGLEAAQARAAAAAAAAYPDGAAGARAHGAALARYKAALGDCARQSAVDAGECRERLVACTESAAGRAFVPLVGWEQGYDAAALDGMAAAGEGCAAQIEAAVEQCRADDLVGPGRKYGSVTECAVGDSGVFEDTLDAVLRPVLEGMHWIGSGVLASFEDEDACFVCRLLWMFVRTVYGVGQAGFGLLAGPMLGLLGIAFAGWLVIQAARMALAVRREEATGGWPAMARGGVRYVIGLVLLGGLSGAGSPTAVFDGVVQSLVGPVLGMSVAGGAAMIGEVGGSGVLEEARRRGGAIVAELEAELPVDGPLRPLATGMMDLAMACHMVGGVGLAKAASFFGSEIGFADVMTALLAAVLGLLLGFMFVMFLITSGLRLLDPVVRVVIVLALSPVLVAAWVFPSTRNAAVVGLRVLAHAAVFFLACGVLFGLALELVLQAVGQTSGLSYAEIVEGVRAGRIGATTLNNELDFFGVVVVFITLLLAEAVMRLPGEVAGQLTDYRIQEGVGEQVEGNVRNMGERLFGLGLHGALSLGGRVAGKLLPG